MRGRWMVGLAACTVAMLVVVVPRSTTAAAGTGSVSIGTNPVLVAPDQRDVAIEVSWAGQTPSSAASNRIILASVCRTSITDPTWDFVDDCQYLTLTNWNGTADGSGSARMWIVRGESAAAVDGEAWGCFAPGDAAPEGIEKVTDCYLRLTNNELENLDEAVETRFTLKVDTSPETLALADRAAVEGPSVGGVPATAAPVVAPAAVEPAVLQSPTDDKGQGATFVG